MKKPKCLNNLPRDLRKMSLEQFEAWVEYFANKTLTELRAWQGVQESQIQMAHQNNQRFDNVALHQMILANCQIMHDVASAAIAMKEFDDDSWMAHIPHYFCDTAS